MSATKATGVEDVEEGGETVMKMGHAAQILINLDPPYHGPVLSTSCYVVC